MIVDSAAQSKRWVTQLETAIGCGGRMQRGGEGLGRAEGVREESACAGDGALVVPLRAQCLHGICTAGLPSLSHAATPPRVTASHSNSEVKLGRGRVVLRWGTTREGRLQHVFAKKRRFSLFQRYVATLNPSPSFSSSPANSSRRRPPRSHDVAPSALSLTLLR